ncbi:hypothetical protein [Pseudovibrio sp. WM33]|uniref:hypothetical protein n=1 Tax=Pseudovibrio sp. WM33 TaxID=1735585 RepID=UPI0007AED9BA|nr:hypothetical protein [Pseudovibrio sp. WM33]KZL24537.1 hypothetical protein PsWM33_02526 [Pseudovibrio sp. WM33]
MLHQDFEKITKEQWVRMSTLTLTIIGAVLAVALVAVNVWTTLQREHETTQTLQQRDNDNAAALEERDAKNAKILERRDKRITELQEQLNEKTDKVTTLQRLLLIKSNQVEDLQRQGLGKLEDQIGHVTGGDSFPVFLLEPNGNHSSPIWEALAVIEGKFALHRVEISAVHLRDGAKPEIVHAPTIERMRQGQPYNNIGLRFDLRGVDEPEIIINSRANNGSFRQVIKFKQIDGIYKYAYKITDGIDPTVVLKTKDYADLPTVQMNLLSRGTPFFDNTQ